MTDRPELPAPASGLQASRRPGSAPTAGPEGAPPRPEPRIRYRPSRPRGRGTAPGPTSSPGISEELKALGKESARDAGVLQQKAPTRYGSCRPNDLRLCPRQLPDARGQSPEGEARKIAKGAAETSACVAKKRSSAVAKPPLLLRPRNSPTLPPGTAWPGLQVTCP